MPKFVPSTSDLFPACVKVLDTKLTPMHYTELTSHAIKVLRLDDTQVNMFRTIEDVREKLPGTQRYDVFYSGKPDYMMARRSWFKNAQMPLFNNHIDTQIVIPGSAQAGYLGAFESLMRLPHMVNKWPNRTTEYRNDKLASGLVLEKHVALWFERNWPEFYLPPDNFGAWEKPCSHDFKLKVNRKSILVDVAGPNSHGAFGRPNKSTTDLHLLCFIDGDNVVWCGVQRGSDYNESTAPETSLSPSNMVVWLNCCQAGIDYEQMRYRIDGGASMAAD